MDTIEGIKLDCDERGHFLILTGDFVDACERYLEEKEATSIYLRVGGALVDREVIAIGKELDAFWREGEALARQHIPMVDDEGYAMDDPKRSDYHSVRADLWDLREGK